MCQVINYIATTPKKLICNRGGLHSEQPLNIVCLDSLCREDPLACSICFGEVHKYHKVVGFDKFISDYSRNIKSYVPSSLIKRVDRQHQLLKENLFNFKKQVFAQFQKFQKSIDGYIECLQDHIQVRKRISEMISTTLQPQQMLQLGNRHQLTKSIKFILDNSLLDDGNSIINVSQLLKQDKDKVYALIDKMVNMTEHCQLTISKAMEELKFAQKTIKTQKISFTNNLKKAQFLNQFPRNASEFMKKQINLQKIQNIMDETQIFHKNDSIINPQKHDRQMETTLPSPYRTNYLSQKKNRPLSMSKIQILRDIPIEQLVSQQIEYKFSKYKHQKLTIINNGTGIISNVSALKPQFALISPHLTIEPLKQKEWGLKIVSCRDFSSANTMGVGIGTLSSLKLSNFEKQAHDVLLISSQGYTLQQGKLKKNEFTFRTGDILDFKYDPFYKILSIEKNNGRKLTLKAQFPPDQYLYICVRLTYASDQIQIL